MAWFTALLLVLVFAIAAFMSDVIKLADYPSWVRALGLIWLIVSAVLTGAIMFTKSKAATGHGQSASTAGNNSPVYQVAGNLTITEKPEPITPANNSPDLQSAQLAQKLTAFRGVFVRVEDQAGAETTVFAEELRASLRLAGLSTNGGDAIVDPTRFAFTGIKVFANEKPVSAIDRAPAAAEAIVQELQRQNFRVNKLPSKNPAQENFIRIYIGMKQ
jgi:hypothetical protein